jgi:hypothetical protein
MNLDLSICRHTYGDGWDGGISGRVEDGCRVLSLLQDEVDRGPRVLRLLADLTVSR